MLKYNNLVSKKSLFIILITLFLIYFFKGILYSTGKITTDSIFYFKMANNFWTFKSPFPLGYPLLLKCFNIVFNNSILSSKLINLICYLLCTLFLIKKNFYPFRLILLLSIYPFLYMDLMSWSESLFYFILTILIYYIHQYIYSYESKSEKRLFIIIPFLFFLLISTRFAGLFFLISFNVYIILGYLKNWFDKKAIYLIIYCSLAVVIYLGINYLYCGHFFGIRDEYHFNNNLFSYFINILFSFGVQFSPINLLPYSHKFSDSIKIITLISTIFLMVYQFRKKQLFNNKFIIFVSICLVITILGLTYSYTQTLIDDSIRVKSMSYYFYFFLLLLMLNKNFVKIIYCISFLAILQNIYFLKVNNDLPKLYSKEKALIENNYKSCQEINIIDDNKNFNSNVSNNCIPLFKSILIDNKINYIEDKKRTDYIDCSINKSEIDLTEK